MSDLGKTTFEGKLVEHYRWSDVILKFIKMQTTDFYAEFTGPTAVPVAARTVLTPFGMAQIGSQNQTWTNWQKVRRGSGRAPLLSCAHLPTKVASM